LETATIALWAANLVHPASSLADWLGQVDGSMEKARSAGASLLALPEFACMSWLDFAPPGLAPAAQMPWLAGVALEALPGLHELVQRHQMALLAGTFPVYDLGPAALPVNRAWLFLPDGRVHEQDKISLTPSEQGLFRPGAQIRVLDWQGWRVAVIVCLDVEFTALWVRLGRLDLDLILVPAKTEFASGYHRVFGCARARAIELQTVVCAVGAIGSVERDPSQEVVGGAAAFLPCEASFAPTGVAAVLEPHASGSGRSPLLICPDLPLGACRRVRHGGAEAEVWPASWSADAVAIAEPGVAA
jgi:predicted amidohydrolase